MHPAQKQHFVGTVDFQIGLKRPHLLITHSSDRFFRQVIWTYQTINLHSTPDCYLLLSNLGRLCTNQECSEGSEILSPERQIHKKIIWHKKPEFDDMLSILDLQQRLVKIKSCCWNWCTLVIFMETCEIAFSGFSVQWKKKSVNLPLLSSGTSFGVGGIGNWLFSSCVPKLGPPSIIYISENSWNVQVFNPYEDSGAHKRSLLVLGMNLL